MLKALLHTRLGDLAEARAAFAAGAARLRLRGKPRVKADAGASPQQRPQPPAAAWRREDAQLLQAWGLFESKYGDLDLARRLIDAAVDLDRDLAGVKTWRMFR